MFHAYCRTALLLGACWLGSALTPVARGQEWYDEDEEHIQQYWETGMSPDEYRTALEVSGMAEAAASLDTRDGVWISTGPIGGPSPFQRPRLGDFPVSHEPRVLRVRRRVQRRAVARPQPGRCRRLDQHRR